jgi:CIC family chloride channel protein
LLPALVSSASGYFVFVAINDTTALFPTHGAPPLSFADLAGAVMLGVAAGICARGFAWMLRTAKSLIGTIPAWVRIIASGSTLVALFALTYLLTNEPIAIGIGYRTIAWALSPHRAIWLLLVVLVVRCVATAATVAGGGVGGLFIPLVVAGALLGRAAGGMVGDANTTLFVVIGVAAFLGAGYRVPLAAVMFVAETTGRPGFVVPGLLAAVAASLAMGRSSVTTYQRGSTQPEPPLRE